MSNSYCSYTGCRELAFYKCTCTNKIKICRNHISTHLLSKGIHMTSVLVIAVSGIHSNRVHTYLSSRIKSTKQKIKELLLFSSKLIETIDAETNKLLNKFRNEIDSFKLQLKSLVINSFANEEVYNIACLNEKDSFKKVNFYIPKGTYTIKNIFNTEKRSNRTTKSSLISYQIKNPSIQTNENCSHAIIFKKDSLNGIDLIDLETFRKTSAVINANCLAYLCGCCKIAPNKFFIYGGYCKDYLSSAGILDLAKYSFDKLQSDSKIGYNGLCLANKEVYCFGGYGSGTLKDSKKFNLEKGVWINIQALPSSNYCTTAAVYKSQILICGYNSAGLFMFDIDKNTFSKTKYTFESKTYKYIFENWIVCFKDHLYEIDECDNMIKHQPFLDEGKNLNSSAYFKRGKEIYFVIAGPKLYRIKTDRKIIE